MLYTCKKTLFIHLKKRGTEGGWWGGGEVVAAPALRLEWYKVYEKYYYSNYSNSRVFNHSHLVKN